MAPSHKSNRIAIDGYVDDYYGYDFVDDDGDPMDDNGHGTHVAGTIAANGSNQFGSVGVAPNAKVMALKFLDSASEGSTFDAIQAIEYAILMGADVTNNSWGGGGYSQALREAIAAAANVGQLFVAAAGNLGIDSDRQPEYPAGYDLSGIISVGASTASDRLSSFSNYGQTSVDILAPGSDIYSTLLGGGYGLRSGTSMATPHVTGAVALLLSAYPELSSAEIKAAILESVDLLPDLENTAVSGGRLNALQALSSAGATVALSSPETLSFEAGLTAWESFGSASVDAVVSDATAPQKKFQAAISTGEGALSAELLEQAVDLSSGSLDELGNGISIEGSALRTTVKVAAGNVLTFDWNFLSDEPIDGEFNDYSFFGVDGVVVELADLSANLSELVQSQTADPAFEVATGYRTLSHTFETDGAVALTLGVVDVNDAQVDSTLVIDNLLLTSPTADAPVAEVPASDIPIADPSALDLAAPNLWTNASAQLLAREITGDRSPGVNPLDHHDFLSAPSTATAHPAAGAGDFQSLPISMSSPLQTLSLAAAPAAIGTSHTIEKAQYAFANAFATDSPSLWMNLASTL